MSEAYRRGFPSDICYLFGQHLLFFFNTPNVLGNTLAEFLCASFYRFCVHAASFYVHCIGNLRFNVIIAYSDYIVRCP